MTQIEQKQRDEQQQQSATDAAATTSNDEPINDVVVVHIAGLVWNVESFYKMVRKCAGTIAHQRMLSNKKTPFTNEDALRLVERVVVK
jgi:hypothetical protein